MAHQELTKEAFKKLFKDNFEMTNYAIKVAQDQIHSGNEDLSLTELLREIRRHPPVLKAEEKAEGHE